MSNPDLTDAQIADAFFQMMERGGNWPLTPENTARLEQVRERLLKWKSASKNTNRKIALTSALCHKCQHPITVHDASYIVDGKRVCWQCVPEDGPFEFIWPSTP